MNWSYKIDTIATWIVEQLPSMEFEMLKESLCELYNPLLEDALLRIARQGIRRGTVDGVEEVERRANDKNATLRNSFSTIASHAASITNRLASTESEIAELKIQHSRELERLEGERDGLRTLSFVWEGRWREERSRREELMEELREMSTQNRRETRDGVVLNGEKERETTRFEVTKGVIASKGKESRKRPSFRTEITSVLTPSTAPDPDNHPFDERNLISDLADDLARIPQEYKNTIAKRDLEIARLEVELKFRRDEMVQLYSSLDSLLVLAPEAGPTQSNQSHGRVEISRIDDKTNQNDLSTRQRQRQVTIEDADDLQPRVNSTGQPEEEDQDETAKLEEEIREMERKIRNISGTGSVEGSVNSVEGSVGSDHEANPSSRDPTIESLERKISEMEKELKAMSEERDELRKFCQWLQIPEEFREPIDGLGNVDVEPNFVDPTSSSPRRPQQPDTQAEATEAYIQRLEADRDRLSQLLEASEEEARNLSSEYSNLQEEVHEIAARVQRKLEAQKAEIADLKERLSQYT